MVTTRSQAAAARAANRAAAVVAVSQSGGRRRHPSSPNGSASGRNRGQDNLCRRPLRSKQAITMVREAAARTCALKAQARTILSQIEKDREEIIDRRRHFSPRRTLRQPLGPRHRRGRLRPPPSGFPRSKVALDILRESMARISQDVARISNRSASTISFFSQQMDSSRSIFERYCEKFDIPGFIADFFSNLKDEDFLDRLLDELDESEEIILEDLKLAGELDDYLVERAHYLNECILGMDDAN